MSLSRRTVAPESSPETQNPVLKPRIISPEPTRDQSLAHSVAWNAIGDWGSQLLGWAAFLVVVRLVPPADFGIAAMAALLLPYMNLVTAFGIPRAVVTLRDMTQDQLAQLNSVSLMISFACFAVAVAVARPFAAFFHSPRLAPIVMIVSSSLLLVGIQGVPAAILAKQLRFRLLTLLGAASSVVSSVVTLVLAITGFGYWALVFGNLAGALCRSVLILRAQPCRLAIPRLDSIGQPLRFGARVMVSMIASSSYSNLDNFVAGRTLGDTALGLYGAAWGLANLPVEKITTLVTTVLPSYLSTVQDQPAVLRSYLKKMTETIALATFPATIGLGLVAHDMVPIVFGSRWKGMAGPLAVLSFYAGFRSITALLPKFLVAVGDVSFVMWNDLAALFLLPCAFYVGSRQGITGIAWGWVVAFPLVALVLYRRTFRILDLTFREYFSVLWPALEGTTVMVLLILLSRLRLTAGWPAGRRVVFEILLGACAYVATMAVRHRDRMRMLVQLGRRLLRRSPGTAEVTS
jgi:O-antigen/teichoic acid export membrane protein